MTPGDRIFVAGHCGLIGSAVVRRLQAEGSYQILTCSRETLDLTDASATDHYFSEHKPDFVVLAAGRVGGILDNRDFPADFIETNLAIQLSVLGAARRHGTCRTVFFGSSCMYPRDCAQPMPEEALFTGKPEPTSIAYATAKLAGVETCLAFNRQYGTTAFLPIIPNSVYGPGDNFDLATGHVLSSLVHRFAQATARGDNEIVLWGSGAPRREFVFVDDVADACVSFLSRDIDRLVFPVNIGCGVDISIRELAEKIAELTGFRGIILWDTEKPDGAPRKQLDCRRATDWGWQAHTTLEEGLRRTIADYTSRRLTSV